MMGDARIATNYLISGDYKNTIRFSEATTAVMIGIISYGFAESATVYFME